MTKRSVLAFVAAATLAGTVGAGAWSHLAQDRQVRAAAEERRNFVPAVRVAAVRSDPSDRVVNLPGTTLAFAAANIYARASGYIAKRNVDIGDRVKAGDLLVLIVAPELDHQIAQAEATLAQLRSMLSQREAARELAKVTWGRDKPVVKQGWLPEQQATIDEQTLRQQEELVKAARSNAEAQESQLKVLHQEKEYQSVIAPFDGVITQRNIDVGSLMQADDINSTFLFTLMHTDVIRTQVYVPQDAAFGVRPGIKAVIRVPEMPGRTFEGTVTRFATALQPGSRTLLTEVDIPNPDGTLPAGVYCTVDLHIPRESPSLTFPAEAVIFNAGGVQVAVVENGVVRLTRIDIARDLGRQIEAREGVKPGDQVILHPPVDLVDGMRVQVRATTSGS
jgi:RND family efflux transporter MFP subunit